MGHDKGSSMFFPALTSFFFKYFKNDTDDFFHGRNDLCISVYNGLVSMLYDTFKSTAVPSFHRNVLKSVYDDFHRKVDEI